MNYKNLNGGMIFEKDGSSEKFNTGKWRNKRPIHLEDKCKNCMLCVPVCPDNAILHNAENKMEGFDYDKCKGCGVCSKVCPFSAIEMEDER